MAVTVVQKAQLSNSQVSNSNLKIDFVRIALDNNYPTGGYLFDLGNYITLDNNDVVPASYSGGFMAQWEYSTQKLVVTRGGVEVPNGTDLSSITEMDIIVYDVPGVKPMNISVATLSSGPTGNAFVKKTGDTVTGTVTVSATGGITTNSGSVTKIGGLISETPTQITGPTIPLVSTRYWVTSAVPEINAVSGTIPDGAKITIFSTDGGTVVKNNATFLNSGSADFTFQANDSITWQYDLGVGKFIQCTSPQFNGTIVTFVGGYVKNEGTEIIPEPTEITANGQAVYGTGNWKVGTATPAELSAFAPPPGNVGATFMMTVKDVVRLINNNYGVTVPTVNGMIVFAGYQFMDPIYGDIVYFRYDPDFNGSGIGAWVVNESYM